MPCDYKQYPTNWKSEIRPAILARAENKCEWCKVPNHSWVSRGQWNGYDVWQNDDGQIFSAKDGLYVGENYVGDLEGKTRLTKICLTIAHIHNPDKMDCKPENLAALCQKCHLGHDLRHHMQNARETRNKKKGLQELF